MTLKNLYNIFASSPEGIWIMQWPNAQSLYDYIKNNNVKRVLDLGTGIGASAAVVSLAFKDKGVEDYHIDSIEQYDKCIRIANKLVPEELRKNITFHKAEPTTWNNEKIPFQYFSVYDVLPEGDYDLIINDGPAPFLSGVEKHYVDLPNGTIHRLILEDKLKSGTRIIYDGRISSLKSLERYFSGNLMLVYVPSRGNDFYVLERKDNPLIFKDEIAEAIDMETPYFKNHDEPKKENIISSDKPSAPSETEATPGAVG